MRLARAAKLIGPAKFGREAYPLILADRFEPATPDPQMARAATQGWNRVGVRPVAYVLGRPVSNVGGHLRTASASVASIPEAVLDVCRDPPPTRA